MKKTIAFVGFLVVAAIAFANGTQESRTIEGKLTFVDSVPTITDGNESWALPPGPFYQVAWENGIKEGDTLKVEGFVNDRTRGDEKMQMIRPTKAWSNGKEVDVSSAGRMGRGPGLGDCTGPAGRGNRGEGMGNRSESRQSRGSGGGKK